MDIGVETPNAAMLRVLTVHMLYEQVGNAVSQRLDGCRRCLARHGRVIWLGGLHAWGLPFHVALYSGCVM